MQSKLAPIGADKRFTGMSGAFASDWDTEEKNYGYTSFDDVSGSDDYDEDYDDYF